MKRVGMSLVVLASIVALVAATGCSGIADKVAEKAAEKVVGDATDSNVDITDDGVTIDGQDGAQTAVGEDVAVPKDFPSDVPVYDASVKGAFADENSWVLNMESDDTTADVMEFYQKKLPSAGWVKVAMTETQDGAMYTAKKGDRQVTVVATGDGGSDGATSIAVSVGRQ